MDNQFDTLSRSYHDNYLQYATTGKESYKTAYESAEKGLKSIIESLSKQVHDNTETTQNSAITGSEGGFKGCKRGLRSKRAIPGREPDRENTENLPRA